MYFLNVILSAGVQESWSYSYWQEEEARIPKAKEGHWQCRSDVPPIRSTTGHTCSKQWCSTAIRDSQARRQGRREAGQEWSAPRDCEGSCARRPELWRAGRYGHEWNPGWCWWWEKDLHIVCGNTGTCRETDLGILLCGNAWTAGSGGAFGGFSNHEQKWWRRDQCRGGCFAEESEWREGGVGSTGWWRLTPRKYAFLPWEHLNFESMVTAQNDKNSRAVFIACIHVCQMSKLRAHKTRTHCVAATLLTWSCCTQMFHSFFHIRNICGGHKKCFFKSFRNILVSVWHATMLPCFVANRQHCKTQCFHHSVPLFGWTCAIKLNT